MLCLGTKLYSDSGVLKSHSSWPSGSYSSRMDKNWHIKSVGLHLLFLSWIQQIRVSEGKRVRITITHMKTEQNYDKLYLTWDICDKGFHSYDTYWHGTGTSLPVSSSHIWISVFTLYNIQFLSSVGVRFSDGDQLCESLLLLRLCCSETVSGIVWLTIKCMPHFYFISISISRGWRLTWTAI